MAIKLYSPILKKYNTWRSLPCKVEGYSMTAGTYANLIKECAARGDFAICAYYLQAAEKSGQLVAIELAAKEK